ncbi:hypothetical protein GCM10011425_13680 [Mucilaginibacter galii]|uniref:histidine kinase n=2 Tax=Mucilaginibacter galii TaxID=2005073 RepID=A0A917J9Z3_9SPHI|nr:hypothetical protein GCM10011425_13680 [Mucilaginibacter galii]
MAKWSNQWGTENKYADSALSFFNSAERKKEYQSEYYKALLANGEACIYLKQYNKALKFYYEAKNIFSVGNCEDGFLGAKIARIYFNQHKYRVAAQLWAEGVNLMGHCKNGMSYPNYFYSMQSFLNGAGLSYEKAGMLDSAGYYYLQDVELINTAGQRRINVSAAKISVYDNLGNLNLKLGNVSKALEYLEQCVAIPITEIDGIKIPPHMKLAQAYLQIKNHPKALANLRQARNRLDRFDNNLNEEVLWYKINAQYLYQIKQGERAYESILHSNRLKDSLENSLFAVYGMDVDHEFRSLVQQQELHNLSGQNKLKQFYLIGSVVTILMAIIIVGLIYRNLKRIRIMHRESDLHNQQLQHAMAEIERANENYIRIMRVMAHDLRNPISGMTGLAAVLLAEEDFTEDNRHMLQLIESTGIHSMEMISELLKTGLADENELLVTEMVDVKNLLYDSVELLQFKAGEKQQLLIFDGPVQPVMCRVSQEKIWRVFNNLIVNAIKFSYEGTQIKVGILQEQHKIIVSVADSGIGIPDKNKDAIFEMFSPAKKVGTKGEQPFGLGLSISKRIIEKHRGKIWFDSTPEIGTTFYVEIPCNEHIDI